MKTVRSIGSLREALREWRGDGERVALVPTMGNLHAGHLSLVELASQHAEHVVVSIFVNPVQFGPREDFQAYPRTPDTDRRRLARTRADLLFMPSVEEMYPRGQQDFTKVCVPGLSAILCGEFRPGHFDGVTSVVARLLNIVQPSVAVFGQKDYQQLVIIRRMVEDLHFPVEVLAAPTQRDADGLALSSRNQYLDAGQRSQAPALHQALASCRERILAGERDYAILEADALAELRRAGFRPDYFTVRDAADLDVPRAESRELVVLSAGRLGMARLIDNVLVDL